MLRGFSRGCPQQVVRDALVNLGERHDTRTNGQRSRPPARGELDGEVADQTDTHNLLRASSRGCHEDVTRKTVPWKLSLREALQLQMDRATHLSLRRRSVVSCKLIKLVVLLHSRRVHSTRSTGNAAPLRVRRTRSSADAEIARHASRISDTSGCCKRPQTVPLDAPNAISY